MEISVTCIALYNVYLNCALLFSVSSDEKTEGWSWASYLEEQKATAAPSNLFQEVSYNGSLVFWDQRHICTTVISWFYYSGPSLSVDSVCEDLTNHGFQTYDLKIH